MRKFTQEQNEALVRLLLAVRYQDASITLPESEEFNRQISALHWKSATAPGVFVSRETPKVREIMAGREEKQRFLEEQCSRFTTPEERQFLVGALQSLTDADGMDPKENLLVAHVESILAKAARSSQ